MSVCIHVLIHSSFLFSISTEWIESPSIVGRYSYVILPLFSVGTVYTYIHCLLVYDVPLSTLNQHIGRVLTLLRQSLKHPNHLFGLFVDTINSLNQRMRVAIRLGRHDDEEMRDEKAFYTAIRCMSNIRLKLIYITYSTNMVRFYIRSKVMQLC